MFPDLVNKTWTEINLDQICVDHFGNQEISPCNDPTFCERWVNQIAKDKNVDFTFGGYLEDRSHLWKGHYHQPDKMIHLGVDYNVPAGTVVSLSVTATVVDVLRDKDQQGGWGGRMIVQPHREDLPLILLAHLSFSSLLDQGTIIEQDSICGIVADSRQNGGWYPHLHVQALNRLFLDAGFDELDGYGFNDKDNELLFPDPRNILI